MKRFQWERREHCMPIFWYPSVYIGPKRMSVKSTHRFCCYLFRERLSKRWIERCKLLLPEENRSLVHAA